MGEVRDIGFGLHEDAVDAPELGQVSGVPYGEWGVGAKVKEGAVIVTDACLFCGQSPVFCQTQGEEIGPALE